MEGIYLSSASYLLLAALTLLVIGVVGDWCLRRRRRRRSFEEATTTEEGSLTVRGVAPGPKPWPIIGSLHLLGGYEIPYQAFDQLAFKYGPVFSIKLGQVQCLVLSSLEHIKEVLVNKGDHFDGRPNFVRYHELFHGDKDNSLAFCDWSEKQKLRRDMLRDHTFPRAFTSRFYQLDTLLGEELRILCGHLSNGVTDVKPLMLQSCANVFLNYFCNVKFSLEDSGFVQMVRNFDYVFYEVNQGYAADFMPWLMPLHVNNLRKMQKWGHSIREFMLDRFIKKRFDNWVEGQEQVDYLDALIAQVQGKTPTMTLETALFALEDIVGGHAAIANLLMKVLGLIASEPDVQKRIQEEVDSVTLGKEVSLEDRTSMPYTEAVILEAIRHISSPIVPHVANQSTGVGGYAVEKDTLIFLNNYTLNMSPELWKEPSKFSPERFLTKEGRLLKPDHFLPFGGGRRSCMGYKMTQFVSFATLATIMQRFHISLLNSYKIPLGNLALPYETIQFQFTPR